MRTWILLSLLVVCSACSSGEKTIRIAATAVPHADILQVVKEELQEEGIDLKIVEVDDYNLPNRMLAERQVDANFFQHKPFLEEQKRLFGYDLEVLTAVHIEPLGIYSDEFDSIESIPDGATVAIPGDPTNEARALLLLGDTGLIKLKNVENQNLLTVLDIEENPKHLKFEELDAPYLPRALRDVDLAVIPVNFALQGNLDPLSDALLLESSESPYANVVVIYRGDGEREAIEKLRAALKSERVKEFIREKYQGAIVPV